MCEPGPPYNSASVDVEQILRARGPGFDRAWVREQLATMYGHGDPRLAHWDDLGREVPGG